MSYREQVPRAASVWDASKFLDASPHRLSGLCRLSSYCILRAKPVWPHSRRAVRRHQIVCLMVFARSNQSTKRLGLPQVQALKRRDISFVDSVQLLMEGCAKDAVDEPQPFPACPSLGALMTAMSFLVTIISIAIFSSIFVSKHARKEFGNKLHYRRCKSYIF